jgi:hypothetical protein
MQPFWCWGLSEGAALVDAPASWVDHTHTICCGSLRVVDKAGWLLAPAAAFAGSMHCVRHSCDCGVGCTIHVLLFLVL